ncbi:sigma-70 family RNA polymerase sigma factor [Sphingobacterium hungaricum]|uniref:RNA polymerase sigma-70 factor n=1 Tax=Sphingobacterium hungaricum TaxID=2082723 RepID=A0A928UUB2_9SPHI|nr:sigma-70 family RNA polymerase sigma factor [Sphingobacterium hungaricum]MBE8713365.1 RNA polymerase sigma-70 factor [Sphingobacterium hungaricum]
MDELASNLFKKYFKGLCYFGWKLIGDAQIAEDLAQDAFTAYLLKKDSISSDEISIKSFLYTNVKFAAYNISRKNKVIDTYWHKTKYSEMDDVDIENSIIQAEFYSKVSQAMVKLPTACQEICRMGYLDGYSNEEISKILQLSVNTVKTQKRRGIEAIRRLIKPELLVFFCVFLFF